MKSENYKKCRRACQNSKCPDVETLVSIISQDNAAFERRMQKHPQLVLFANGMQNVWVGLGDSELQEERKRGYCFS